MTGFLTYIVQYRDRLVNHAFYRLGDFEEAEDIVQMVISRNIIWHSEMIIHKRFGNSTGGCK